MSYSAIGCGFVWLLVLLAPFATAAEAPDSLIARIDALMAEHIERGTVPGASVVLVAEGEIQHAKGFGFARLPHQPATAETIFSLGSVSKNFVGLALNRLADSGALQLDRAVLYYLPKLKIDNPFDTPLSVRHLLNHTSGFSTYIGNRNQQEVALNATALATSLEVLGKTPLHSEPGTRFEYSNANYQILGVLLERLTGQTFPAAMQALVFDPLQLSRSRIGHDFSDPQASDGYRFWLQTPRSYRVGLGSALEPQGGVSSTALDLGRYLLALTGGNATTPNIYQPSWAATAPTQKDKVGYGPGWSVRHRATGPLFYHHGLNPGFSAAIAFDPGTGRGIAVMANASDGFVAGDLTWLMEAVLAEVFPELSVARVDSAARWIQLLAVVAILLGICGWAMWFIRRGLWQTRRPLSWVRIMLPSVALLGLAWVIGVTLPPLLRIPLAGVVMFSPDIGWLFRALFWLAAGWGVLRLGLLLSQRQFSRHLD